MKDETRKEMAATCATGETLATGETVATGETLATGETGATGATVADIVRELRNLGKLDEKSTDMIPRRLMGLSLRTYADRIEAAAEREARTREQAAADYALKRGQQAAPDYYLAALSEFYAEIRKALEQMRQGCANIGYTASQVREWAEDYTARLREAPGNAAALRPAGRKTGSPKK